MEEDEECITGLSLGLGTAGNVPKREKQKVNKPVASLDLAFELCPEDEAINNVNHNKEDRFSLQRIGEVQQYPNAKSADNTTTNKNSIRKKLRLTKEQSALLENSFKLHTTLNSVFIHTKPSVLFLFFVYFSRNLFSSFILFFFIWVDVIELFFIN